MECLAFVHLAGETPFTRPFKKLFVPS